MSANRAGFGFVRIEGQEEAVFLPPPQMAGVMHGDRVRVSVERGRDGRYSGRLEKILEHATKAFVGTLEVHGRTAFVTSADRRIGMRCLVPPDELGGARHGDWVIAAMTRYAGSGASPQARIVKRLDPEKPVELGLRIGHRALRSAARVFTRGRSRGGILWQRSRSRGSGAARGPARTCRW